MKAKKMIASAMALALTLGMFGATMVSTSADAAKKVKVKSVSVAAPYAKQVTLAKGKSVKLAPIVTVTPDKKANREVKYVSRNKKIATVSAKGVVKGKAVGSTKVVVSSKKNAKKKVSINIKVIKNAVKKIKLNSTTATLNPGETLVLKSTVTPAKKVNKDIVWTSSKTGVATVSDKGVVTAVAPGTTEIKAAAIDGSKKTAKCTITVQQVTNIVKAEVVDEATMLVTLSRAEALTAPAFTIQSKSTAEGTYLKNYTIKGMNTTDMINYELIVDYDNESFYNGHYVKVSIPTLSGVKTCEFKAQFRVNQAGPREQVITGDTNCFIGENMVSFGRYITGEASYTVSGLPAGLTPRIMDGDLYITGTPTAIADNVIAVATAIDETGKTVSKNIRILVGSESAIVSYIEPVILLSNHQYRGSNRMYIVGGSGFYDVQCTLDAGLTTSGDVTCSYNSKGYFDFDVNNKIVDMATNKKAAPALPAGNYSVSCQVTDQYNKALVHGKLAAVSVMNGVTVTGILTDAAGAPIAGEYVSAECVSSNDLTGYDYCGFESDYPTDSTGKYILRLFEGKSYDIYGRGAMVYNQLIPATGANINLKSACYKVTIPTIANNTNLYCTKENYDFLNNDPGYNYLSYVITATDRDGYTDEVRNNVIYVLPGTYSFRNLSTLYSYDAAGNVTGSFDMKVSFTVTNTGIIAAPVITDQLKGSLVTGTPVNVTIDAYCGAYLTFTAPEDGTYEFSYDSSNIGSVRDDSPDVLRDMVKGESFMYRLLNKTKRAATVIGVKAVKIENTDK